MKWMNKYIYRENIIASNCKKKKTKKKMKVSGKMKLIMKGYRTKK